MKRLFLASEAKHPKSIELLKKFVGGNFKDKKIVYVPTAANGDFYQSWKASKTLPIAQSLTNNLEVVELESYYYQDVEEKIRSADILWMAGGQTGYLLYWLRRLELDKNLPKILENGPIYVGSSAGSMVCSKTQYASEFYFTEPEKGASIFPGLGIIDFEIYPHYEEKWLPKLKNIWKKEFGDLWLLKNGEVITVEGDKVNVLGEKRILRNGKLLTL